MTCASRPSALAMRARTSGRLTSLTAPQMAAMSSHCSSSIGDSFFWFASQPTCMPKLKSLTSGSLA